MFPNDCNIKWTQLQSKHGICLKLGALVKYFQFILINKSIANWNYLFAGIEQRLIQQFASTSSQSYSHSKDRFFKKKIIMNKSSSPLLHLHLHLLHFFDNEQIFIFRKKKKKETFKKGLGTRGIRLVFLRFLSKKKKFKIFNSLKKFKISKFKKKKKKKLINQNFQFLRKKKKKSLH